MLRRGQTLESGGYRTESPFVAEGGSPRVVVTESKVDFDEHELKPHFVPTGDSLLDVLLRKDKRTRYSARCDDHMDRMPGAIECNSRVIEEGTEFSPTVDKDRGLFDSWERKLLDQPETAKAIQSELEMRDFLGVEYPLGDGIDTEQSEMFVQKRAENEKKAKMAALLLEHHLGSKIGDQFDPMLRALTKNSIKSQASSPAPGGGGGQKKSKCCKKRQKVKPKLYTWEQIKEELRPNLLHASKSLAKSSHSVVDANAPTERHNYTRHWLTEEESRGRGEAARLIKVGIEVCHIWTVDDASQSIFADVFFEFSWTVNAKREEVFCPVTKTFRGGAWKMPVDSMFTNLKGEADRKEFFDCKPIMMGKCHDSYEDCRMFHRVCIKGTFAQNFHLKKFPFDEQTCEIVINIWKKPYYQVNLNKKKKWSYHKPIEFKMGNAHGDLSNYNIRGRYIVYEDPEYFSRVKKDALYCQDEWDLSKWARSQSTRFYRVKCLFGLTCPEDSPRQDRQYPELRCQFKIKRRPTFVKWNIVAPVWFVISMALGGGLTKSEIELDRTSFNASLLFVLFGIFARAANGLSKLGYLTRLDRLMLYAIMLIVALSFMDTALGHFDPMDYVEDPNRWHSMLGGFKHLPISIALWCFWTWMTLRMWNGKSPLPRPCKRLFCGCCCTDLIETLDGCEEKLLQSARDEVTSADAGCFSVPGGGSDDEEPVRARRGRRANGRRSCCFPDSDDASSCFDSDTSWAAQCKDQCCCCAGSSVTLNDEDVLQPA